MHTQNYSAIRAHYERNKAEILAADRDEFGIDPYEWDGLIQTTVIEDWMWAHFRDLGIVMYPQYPVGRYFVDFANPKAHVAIECDGAEFHRDLAADRRRQHEIQALGWTVYRFTGRECKEATEGGDSGGTRDRLRVIAAMHRISELTSLTEANCAAFLEHEAPRLAKFA